MPSVKPDVPFAKPAWISEYDVLPDVAVDEADAVEQQRRGERAQQHVLQAGLVRARVRLRVGDEDVEAEAQQLQRDVRRQQLPRRRHVDRADRRDRQQRVVLAGLCRFFCTYCAEASTTANVVAMKKQRKNVV